MAQAEGWTLQEATDRDLRELMSWFSDERSVLEWGGPEFRYPCTEKSLCEETTCRKMLKPMRRFKGASR